MVKVCSDSVVGSSAGRVSVSTLVVAGLTGGKKGVINVGRPNMGPGMKVDLKDVGVSFILLEKSHRILSSQCLFGREILSRKRSENSRTTLPRWPPRT